MEFGQKIRSKATGMVGELLGINGNKLIVTFGNTDGIETFIEYLDIDNDLREEIEKEISNLKSKKKSKKKLIE